MLSIIYSRLSTKQKEPLHVTKRQKQVAIVFAIYIGILVVAVLGTRLGL